MSKRILITGASGHVGSGMARYFAEQGYDLILAGRDGERLQHVADGCGSKVDIQVHLMDLNDPDGIEDLVAKVGIVDWLVNNAADVTSQPLMRSDPNVIAKQVDANVTGTILLTRGILSGMIERGEGAIINISSLAGYKANPGQTVYSVTKSALNAFSEALRMELRAEPVHIVNVALASVSEGEHRARGQVTTREVAQSIERAVKNEQPVVYFSMATRLLMKLYAAFPHLRLLRPPHNP